MTDRVRALPAVHRQSATGQTLVARSPARQALDRSAITESVRGELDFGMRFHREAGLPGGDETVMVLYLAMRGLLLEHLTLPDVLDSALPGVNASEGLMERIVQTIVPEH